MDLFDHAHEQRMRTEAPLAARMRPRTLEEFVGQVDILGPGKLLRRAIEADRLFSSIILWGPPGSGKTTLAMVIANLTRSHFDTLSAVLAGKAELREVLEAATERRKLYQKKTILFVDEVHRWNKAQQDALLPHVENGTITLVGGAIYSAYLFWRKKVLLNRMVGNILIAAGAMMPAIGGTFVQAGLVDWLYLSEFIGVILMYAGFMQATAQQPVANPRAAVPTS